MTKASLRLQLISFHGPERESVEVPFRPGLNVIVGPSETGKSFLVEAIDFMLGGSTPLRESPERAGYDTIVLQVATSDARELTFQRSIDGGPFLFKEGAHRRLDATDSEPLREKHSAGRSDNFSAKLLEVLALSDKIIRRSKTETRPLSFRDLAFLSIVDESRIWSVGSPVLSGQYTDTTSEKSVFKLALTGIDDSSLVLLKSVREEVAGLDTRRRALVALIAEREAEGRAKARDEAQGRLDAVLSRLSDISESVEVDEQAYADATRKRHRLQELASASERRLGQISSLGERFALLDEHYSSDLLRLEAIAEAGAIFDALHPAPCPFCGAAPEAQQHTATCDVDPAALARAAAAEMERIRGLRQGLAETRRALESEARLVRDRGSRALSQHEQERQRARELFSTLRDRRRGVGDLNREAADLRSELFQAQLIASLREEVEKLDLDIKERNKDAIEPDQSIPVSATTAFAEVVEKILEAWNIPGVGRVAWEASRTDITIGNRRRGDRGKGLRAVTCAAFLLALLHLCRANGRPHAGFVVLDSPLLAYWKPEGQGDDLQGTDVDERFYGWLVSLPADHQTVIIENKAMPDWVAGSANVVHFTGNPKQGRYGLFPPASGVRQET